MSAIFFPPVLTALEKSVSSRKGFHVAHSNGSNANANGFSHSKLAEYSQESSRGLEMLCMLKRHSRGFIFHVGIFQPKMQCVSFCMDNIWDLQGHQPSLSF